MRLREGNEGAQGCTALQLVETNPNLQGTLTLVVVVELLSRV